MVCVCQPQSQGQWFWSVHHYGDFESDQESFHKKSVLELFLTLFSGREGWAAWPSAPSHVAYFLRNLCTTFEETSVAPQKSQWVFIICPQRDLHFSSDFSGILLPFNPRLDCPTYGKTELCVVVSGPLYLFPDTFSLFLWQKDWCCELADNENDATKWLDFPVRCATFRRWYGGDDDNTGWNDSHQITPTSRSRDGRWASKAGTHGNSLPSKKPHERLLPRV